MMDRPLLRQFSGFLETPEIRRFAPSFPYPSYLLQSVPLSEEPAVDIPPTTVLGKRMEYFFDYYVTHFSDDRILASNEQIQDGKRTIGELDFLLCDKITGRYTHVELVYKFYLFNPAAESRWIGPNWRDNLGRKLTRLLEFQFPLLYRPQTRPLLQRLGITRGAVNQKICFKANCFLPWNLGTTAAIHDIPGGYQGYWLQNSQFKGPAFEDALFFTPKKPDWPVFPEYNETWYSYEEINQQLRSLLERKRSPLVWMKTAEGHYCRFFVVWW